MGGFIHGGIPADSIPINNPRMIAADYLEEKLAGSNKRKGKKRSHKNKFYGGVINFRNDDGPIFGM